MKCTQVLRAKFPGTLLVPDVCTLQSLPKVREGGGRGQNAGQQGIAKAGGHRKGKDGMGRSAAAVATRSTCLIKHTPLTHVVSRSGAQRSGAQPSGRRKGTQDPLLVCQLVSSPKSLHTKMLHLLTANLWSVSHPWQSAFCAPRGSQEFLTAAMHAADLHGRRLSCWRLVSHASMSAERACARAWRDRWVMSGAHRARGCVL